MPSLRPLPSSTVFAAYRADEAAERKHRKFNSKRVLAHTKYPGRNLVMHRSDVLDLNYRQYIEEQGDTGARPYKCSNPFVIRAIGLPDAIGAMDRYWKGIDQGKAFAEVESRCRKCENCLAHRRRLWSARATDELKAAHRTWFATLTVSPENRFVAAMHAAATSAKAGHGSWHGMTAPNQFRYLVKYLNLEIDRYLKRVRKSGAPFRYLLVSEAHKDGFPHFHLLIHEAALPLTKRLLESNWRLGYSQFRLVNNSDPRSAFYVCKYLAKSALTRVRASKRYGRDQLVIAGTEAVKELATLREKVFPGPVPGVPGEVIVEPG